MENLISLHRPIPPTALARWPAHAGPDILLVNPGCAESIYQSLASDLTAIEPPIWVGLIACYLRAHGVSVQILDAEAVHLSPEATADEAIDRDPGLIAMIVYGHQPSASTQNMTAAEETCAALRRNAPHLPLLIGGGHPSALPERTLRETGADFVCEGEGPRTLLQLAGVLDSGDAPDLSGVEGLWYWRGGEVAHNAPATLIQDLDRELPGIAWDLLPMTRYRAHNWHCFDDVNRRTPYASLYTSLGCPFRCTFCCINTPFGKASYRHWSPDSVIAEIDLLVNRYGVRNIKIADEMFVLNERHVLGVCDRILSRGYDLNIWAYARVDTVKERMLDKLRRAGFRWLALGIESGSAHVRDGADKSFGDEEIRRTVRAIQEAGIHVIGNYIFGLPDDDVASMRRTLDLAIELNCEFGNFYCAMAYPGSPLYRMALAEGWPLPERWSAFSQHAVDTRALPTKYVPADVVLRFRDEAFHTYYGNPPYLDAVERKFGRETADHVKNMSGRRLARKYA